MKPLPFLAAVLIITLQGCTPPTDRQKTGATAVLNLDRVANELGWSQQINEALQSKDKALGAQLQRMQSEFQTQIASKAKEFGEAPTEGQEKQLQQMMQQANQVYQRALASAQQDQQKHRLQLINAIRQAVRPIAIDVAKSKNCSVVLLMTDSVFYHDPATDITDEVITEAQTADLRPLEAPLEETTDKESAATSSGNTTAESDQATGTE
ncbi:MAG: OmpH family outer membrane protein [Candidatus Pacebacteria bacterium]|nr:OmpH family outer membrane protein [Candidatus Paceibacterota bacterium]